MRAYEQYYMQNRHILNLLQKSNFEFAVLFRKNYEKTVLPDLTMNIGMITVGSIKAVRGKDDAISFIG